MKKVILVLFMCICLFGFNKSVVFAADGCNESCKYPDEQSCRDCGCYWDTVRKDSGETVGVCSSELQYVTCGSTEGIPAFVPRLTSFAVTIIKYVVPLVLIIMSMVSIVRAVTSGSADDTPKVKVKIIKKFIAAFLVFLVVALTQFVVLKAADSTEKSDIRACFNCLLNNNCKTS